MQRRAQLGADGGPGADVGGQLGGGGRGRGLQRDRDQAMEILSTRRRCWWPRLSGSGLQGARAGVNGGGGEWGRAEAPSLVRTWPRLGGEGREGLTHGHPPCLVKHRHRQMQWRTAESLLPGLTQQAGRQEVPWAPGWSTGLPSRRQTTVLTKSRRFHVSWTLRTGVCGTVGPQSTQPRPNYLPEVPTWGKNVLFQMRLITRLEKLDLDRSK